jgi:uncharacterized protein
MNARPDIGSLARALRASKGLNDKAEISLATAQLGVSGDSAIPVGDDCAAIPDGDGYLLFAVEGFMNEFVAGDPWFAGWCGAMVNISDIAAMGGRPTAIVNAVWSDGARNAAPVLTGLREASEHYGVPIVGGHTNLHNDRGQFSVAIVGRAKRLLTSFDAKPGDHLIAAIDLRGRYRELFSNWEAATDASASQLRGDLEILPAIAEAGLSRAAKDISQGGLIGTAAMLAECSGVSMTIDVVGVPMPPGVDMARWLTTFPSYGYLLAVSPPDIAAVIDRFKTRGIACADIGTVGRGTSVAITNGTAVETIWDFAAKPLLGCALRESAA